MGAVFHVVADEETTGQTEGKKDDIKTKRRGVKLWCV